MLIIASLCLLASLLGWVSYLYPGGSMWTIGVSAFSPYLIALAVPSAVAVGFDRAWFGLAAALISLTVFVFVQAPLYKAAPTPPPGGRSMVIMTFNMKIGAADAAEVVAQVRRRHVDALMLEELTPEAQRRLLAAGLEHLLPYRLSKPFPSARGTGLWSRYRLTELPWKQLAFNSVAASVDLPGRSPSPTLVALHIAGPVPEAMNWSIDLRRLPGLLGDLPRGRPVLIGGDFNATYSVRQFRKLLTHGYRDAGEQAGAGLARTYPADTWLPPLIGIDHVLTKNAVGTSVETIHIAGSDHRAVVATVVLPEA